MEITSNTELPSIREEIELRTSDGEVLVGEIALPKDKPVKVTLITLHPLPTHGGFMDSHILRKMANDSMALHVETTAAHGAEAELKAQIAEAIRDVTKLRSDVHLVAPGTLANDGKVIEDARSYQ